MARTEYWTGNVIVCNTVSEILSPNEIPGIDQDHMAYNVLYCSLLLPIVINLFMFVGNWDILTLLVMGDIMYFMLVTACGVNIIYGVIFVLVADLVVCIYVIYL